MRILEDKYMIDYLKMNTVPYDKWQLLAENCFNKGFDDSYINYIDSVITAKVSFNSSFKKIEKIDYQNMIMDLILRRFDIVNQRNINKSKIKVKKKIQKLI